MSRKKTKNASENPLVDYRHDATRKNNPPAGLAAQGKLRDIPKIEFAYNPHLPPVLLLDPTGAADKVPELLESARTRPLTAEEAKLLAQALRNHEPWFEWAGKRERKSFQVDPVALHIHERIATQAILKVAKREDVQRSLFADPQQDYHEAVQFYQHDVDWANRMILGDSLQVMASLSYRENLAGKVQTIYIDPPYGIKFASNFQPEIGRRDVKDRETDLTREPETVKAYRDTWTLGIHSYLEYLRDRFILARELLTDTGSIFVQISDENLHRVRCVLDEVFGPENFSSVITVRKTGGLGSSGLTTVADYLIWYAKDRTKIKYHQIYVDKAATGFSDQYNYIEMGSGETRTMNSGDELPVNVRAFQPTSLHTMFAGVASCIYEFELNGKKFKLPSNRQWSTTYPNMMRLALSGRVHTQGNTPRFYRYLDDFPVTEITNLWNDVMGTDDKFYVVQTNTKVIQRCLLMTTDPGDLVLDPTCGSGTTAFVAEQWGRRWITIDTSRVALALARQRILTAAFPFYSLKEGDGPADEMMNPSKGFAYRTVPHITLRSIAQNAGLDSSFAKHQLILNEKLGNLNNALKTVTPDLRQKLQAKLREKEKHEGKRAATDADRRRWLLPKEEWKEWQVPFDTDRDWTDKLKTALNEYRAAWRAKMDEVNAGINANAEQEELVDQPEVVRNVVRVSGPFTMEAVMPAEESLDWESPMSGEPDKIQTFGLQASFNEQKGTILNEPINAEAYLDKMLRLLRADGVRFPNNKVAQFTRLEPISGGEYLHAEGEWKTENGQPCTVAVSFGPQFGSVTAFQVENALRMANRRGFDELVFAGFSFDSSAQATIQDDSNPNVQCHLAHIRPDVNMGDLLKEIPNSQIFTVFGSPRTKLSTTEDGMYVIEMQGVDIYNPVDNTILPTNVDKVAAWFLDTDYDGRTFCITQAFFPDKSSWGKIAQALKAVVEEDHFAALSGTISIPFRAGKYMRAAVKVIDPRGNEVLRVHKLSEKEGVRNANV